MEVMVPNSCYVINFLIRTEVMIGGNDGGNGGGNDGGNDGGDDGRSMEVMMEVMVPNSC